jgi:DNA-binding response OmpR family regulator
MLELNFLEQLATSGDIVKREQLLIRLYRRYDEHSSRALDSLVRRLRAKIAEAGISDPDPIKTARSIGYSFAGPIGIK